ncbi:hypothetical protein F5X98DRAFT_329963 [Xylaria grammica]|nr:hypothetical protein F5X98DRAFT_329963 [Xylaria grammica]
MQTLCMNSEEGIIAAAPSHDVLFRVARSDVLADVQAKLIRREGYFRALLVQSRGVVVPVCREGARGGCHHHGGAPFFSCRHVPGFQGSACGACVWRSHGARCSHENKSLLSIAMGGVAMQRLYMEYQPARSCYRRG